MPKYVKQNVPEIEENEPLEVWLSTLLTDINIALRGIYARLDALETPPAMSSEETNND